MDCTSKAKIVPTMKTILQPAVRRRSRLALGLCVLLLAGQAVAERADRDQPMQIESDTLRYEDQKQLSTFTGRVVVTKGTIVMRGARLQVRQDAAGNQFGTMYAEPGKRAFFRQKRDGVDEYIEGEAETIDYDGKSDTVHFLRRAEMRRLAGTAVQDQVTGDRIVYNNRTEVYTVDGAPAGDAGGAGGAANGRVRAILAPRTNASGATAAGDASAAPALPLQPSTALPEPRP